MRTIPITASKEENRELVIEWNEFLAQENIRKPRKNLTARFFVRKVNEEEITLAFIDLHVT